MKKTFQFSLKIKNCKKQFTKGCEKGVVALEEIEFTEGRFDFDHPIFTNRRLPEEKREFINRYIEIKITEKQKRTRKV